MNYSERRFPRKRYTRQTCNRKEEKPRKEGEKKKKLEGEKTTDEGKRERTSGNQATEKKESLRLVRGKKKDERSAAERIERGEEEEELLEVEKEEKVARGRRGTERRGVVLTRTGAFLIIICLSLRISREERGTPRGGSGDGRQQCGSGDEGVPRKKRGLEEKEGALSRGERKKEREKPRKSRWEARGKE